MEAVWEEHRWRLSGWNIDGVCLRGTLMEAVWEEHRWRLSKKRLLTRMFEPKADEVTGSLEKTE
jgi:hypothetical protein